MMILVIREVMMVENNDMCINMFDRMFDTALYLI